MTSTISSAVQPINRAIHKMGHILTLVASLGLWFGVYAVVASTVSSDHGTVQTTLVSPQLGTMPDRS